MQLKYSFKKELIQFFRTFKIWGIIICVLSFGLGTPMLFKFTEQMLKYSQSMEFTATFAPQQTPSSPSGSDILGESLDEMLSMYTDAGMMFYMTAAMFSTYSLLVILLILMSAAGGEQKKRAMIVPMCSGLNYKNYLLPKFTIYPLTIFVIHFLCSMLSGAACNAMFSENHLSVGRIALISFLISIYVMFIVTVFLSVGICTSRPGAAVPIVFLGEMMLESILGAMGLTEFHPFALPSYAAAIAGANGEYPLSEHTGGIVVAVVLAIVISVMMYFLALGVLSAKKVDNQAEDIPEF